MTAQTVEADEAADDVDDIFIARGPHCFGMADTQEQAVLNCKMHAPTPGGMYAPDDNIDIIVHRGHPDTGVSNIDGGLTYPEGHPPEKVDELTLYEEKQVSELEEGDVLDDVGEFEIQSIRCEFNHRYDVYEWEIELEEVGAPPWRDEPMTKTETYPECTMVVLHSDYVGVPDGHYDDEEE